MIRIGLFGAAHGHVAYALDEARQRENVHLVGAVEPDVEARTTHLASVPDLPLFDNDQALLGEGDIDVAVVSGRYSMRARSVIAALEAGADVLADKPLCTTLEDLEQIREVAVKNGRRVSVMFEKRHYPETLAARKLLAEGTLGELALVASTGPHKMLLPHRPQWFLDPKQYGGIANDLPVHDIDLVLTLAAAEEGWVSATTGCVRAADHPGFDDHVALILQAGPVAATIEANWLSPEAAPMHGHYRMRLTGSEGTAEIDWALGHVTVATHDREPWQEPLPVGLRPAQDFFDALEEGREPEVSTKESLLATHVALLAQASADRQGKQLLWQREHWKAAK